MQCILKRPNFAKIAKRGKINLVKEFNDKKGKKNEKKESLMLKMKKGEIRHSKKVTLL